MSKHLEAFLKRNRELAEAATPGPWVTERFDADNGYIHFSVNDSEMQQVAFCHEDTHPKTYRADASLMAASRTSLPLALEMLSMACEALRKIGYTQDVSPADPETGGPCRIATANSRNRRILEAQEALAALEEKAGRG